MSRRGAMVLTSIVFLGLAVVWLITRERWALGAVALAMGLCSLLFAREFAAQDEGGWNARGWLPKDEGARRVVLRVAGVVFTAGGAAILVS